MDSYLNPNLLKIMKLFFSPRNDGINGNGNIGCETVIHLIRRTCTGINSGPTRKGGILSKIVTIAKMLTTRISR